MVNLHIVHRVAILVGVHVKRTALMIVTQPVKVMGIFKLISNGKN